MWLSILAVIILFFSFLGGLKEGAVKKFFSLISLLIAIPITGISYHFLASVFSFLPGAEWHNFVGFLVTLALINIILHFVFLLPRRLLQTVVFEGFLLRFLGGALGFLQAAVGLTVFALLVYAYPVTEGLERAVASSGVLTWLVVHLGFVQSMLPTAFHVMVDTITV